MYQKYQSTSMKYHNTDKKTFKIGRYVIWAIILIILYKFFFPTTITPPKNIVLQKWQTVQQFFAPLSVAERTRMKIYMATHSVDTKNVQAGTYIFSWSYTPSDYINTIIAWPTNEYIRYTMLEGWSLYDIDADMTKKWIITAWEFLAKTQNPDYIKKLISKFPFLQQDKELTTLEWFLYPDTYHLSNDMNPIDAFVQVSLKRFNEKIYSLRTSQNSSFVARVQTQGVTLSFPWALALASVIEKEERNNTAKPTIAGIFINRLAQGIQLGADITLCYGRQEPYETCTPSKIVAYLRDDTNIYNTRIHKWLTPTPISSVTAETFSALMNYKNTTYLFYLHDMKWNIYYAETNAQHEENKAKYLQ